MLNNETDLSQPETFDLWATAYNRTTLSLGERRGLLYDLLPDFRTVEAGSFPASEYAYRLVGLLTIADMESSGSLHIRHEARILLARRFFEAGSALKKTEFGCMPWQFHPRVAEFLIENEANVCESLVKYFRVSKEGEFVNGFLDPMPQTEHLQKLLAQGCEKLCFMLTCQVTLTDRPLTNDKLREHLAPLRIRFRKDILTSVFWTNPAILLTNGWNAHKTDSPASLMAFPIFEALHEIVFRDKGVTAATLQDWAVECQTMEGRRSGLALEAPEVFIILLARAGMLDSHFFLRDVPR